MNDCIIGLRIQYRRVAAAVFSGMRLDYAQTRELASDVSRAEASVTAFLSWIFTTFHPSLVGLESIDNPLSTAGRLTATAKEILGSSGIPVIMLSAADLLGAFGHPPLRTRTEMRKVLFSIWPALNSRGAGEPCADAAAAGLYLTVERLFNIQLE